MPLRTRDGEESHERHAKNESPLLRRRRRRPRWRLRARLPGAVRAAGRLMLLQAAANEWKVPVSELSVANSLITHRGSGRTTTYGKVAEAAAKLEPPKEVKLKDPKDWKVAGKPLKRLDTLDKLTGKMIYGIDVRLPNMQTATVKACPVIGGKLKSFDAARIEKMPGVKKVVAIDGNA